MSTKITVEVTVHAPIEKVWNNWTEPRHIIRWNNASDDWCTLKASNDLKPGGRFSSTMSAKDGSFSFDFEGVYDAVKHHELIQYTMNDGRKASVQFTANGNKTTITETFDAETENPVEMQQEGWQNILNNFKKHVEGEKKLEVIYFSAEINAPVENVFKIMLEDEPFKQWTAEFNPTSSYRGSWDKGSKMLFIGTDENGVEGGMVSHIRENVANSFISIEHLGLVKGKEEITSGAEVEGWAGCLENYTFINQNGKTILEVDMDANPDFKSYFEEAWPRALKKLKLICES
jgi:uncharacterized protein YndB with AHSA1/START domain